MMTKLLKYSAISTKIKSMESQLMNAEDIVKICSLHSTAEFVSYIKNIYDYKEIFTHIDESSLHRGTIESMLTYSKYMDFLKIYKFVDLKTRSFLDIFFLRFEIDAIKECLRCAIDPDLFEFDAKVFQDFFINHTSINPQQLLDAPTMPEFIQCLSGTIYYDILINIPADNDHLFEMESALDLFFYKTYWKYQKKYLNGSEQKNIRGMIGAEIDLMNICWIYRMKHFFQMPSSVIYSHIIPICTHLSKSQLQHLVEASSPAELDDILSKTAYGKYLPVFTDHLDNAAEIILSKIHGSQLRKNPYSIACILKFLYQKSVEIHTLTTALECIRYQLPPNEILEYVKDGGQRL
ncbi:MAG: V-type ATPase subunit [Lachnospiraceae bacterium]|nr:V-type ATPase subunit [Lachnospiraceae bacterium]